MNRRIKYYSSSDLSSGYHLQQAEPILLQEEKAFTDYDINDVIELYNIGLFFENNIYLKSWDDEKKKIYIARVNKNKGIIGRMISLINESNVEDYYEKIETVYLTDFWEVFSKYKVYERISCGVISSLIQNHPRALKGVLHQKQLVITYDETISNLLESNVGFAELVLNYYLVKRDRNASKMYMPKSFGKEQQKTLLDNYINWDDANPNYLHLISYLKKHDDFVTDDRLRFAAYKKYVEKTKKLFSDRKSTGINFGVSVRFYDDTSGVAPEPTQEKGVQDFDYGTSWFKENLDYPTLLNNFIYVFEFVDSQFRYQHLSNPSQLGVFESLLGVHGVREYATGISYQAITMLSLAQMTGYINILKENGIRLENIFKWFFETYLKEEFKVEGFVYSEPSEGATHLEKILLLISQIDSVIKQFRFYIEDERIDREFFEFSSQMFKLSDTPSMLEGKYVYPSSVEINNAMHCLYSDQSMICYTEKTTDKYDTLPKLLMNEHILMTDFEEYVQRDVDWLLECGYIFEDDDRRVCINKEKAYILKELFENGVLSISYFGGTIRKELDNYIQSGQLTLEKTLFTRQEQDFLDYMLNVQQFNNGPELRNKYVHGTYPLDEKHQERDYLELLKIMILIIIKINEEFCLREDKQRLG